MTGFCFFLKKLLLRNVSYIELFTKKIQMFTVEYFFFCPDGITPNSGLTGPNNSTNLYIYIYI